VAGSTFSLLLHLIPILRPRIERLNFWPSPHKRLEMMQQMWKELVITQRRGAV
jgi:hypothetical protein